jgi:hypothetical protein
VGRGEDCRDIAAQVVSAVSIILNFLTFVVLVSRSAGFY